LFFQGGFGFASCVPSGQIKLVVHFIEIDHAEKIKPANCKRLIAICGLNGSKSSQKMKPSEQMASFRLLAPATG
jgi:hypothetical protein